MSDLAVAEEAPGATVAPRSRPYIPRKKKRITGRSIAIIAFLAMCALFFCVPLYVVLTTSLKTMDEIRQGAIFGAAAGPELRGLELHLEPGLLGHHLRGSQGRLLEFGADPDALAGALDRTRRNSPARW